MPHGESHINSQPMESTDHVSPTPVPTSSDRTAAEIQDWMVSYMARQLNTVRDEIDVKVDTRILEGESIGSVGETGSLQGPRLYFELRKDGQPVDPEPWLLDPRG